jgi:hypothetical protein
MWFANQGEDDVAFSNEVFSCAGIRDVLDVVDEFMDQLAREISYSPRSI